MKFGVVTFPGSNCDQDMMYILRDVMNQEVVHLWHKAIALQKGDGPSTSRAVAGLQDL